MLIAIIVLGGLLICGGIIGLLISLFMFGDIGIAAGIGSMSGLFSGIGLLLTGIKLRTLNSYLTNLKGND